MPQAFAEEFKSFPISPQLGESLERAHRFAREQSHRLVTLEHLLLALSEDVEAVVMLEAASVDLGRLRADVSGYLGGLMEDMRADGGAQLGPDADLLRVLKAATTAAQQSRRRHIDGAIVLAAIVGDGKSSAAGLLKALGLTFEDAIRALQRSTVAQARVKAAPAASAAGRASSATPAASESPLATSAEEFLAAARARIQQRAAAARANETAAAPLAPALAAAPSLAPSLAPTPASPLASTLASTLGSPLAATPPAAPTLAPAAEAPPGPPGAAKPISALSPQSLTAAIREVAAQPEADRPDQPPLAPREPVKDAAEPVAAPPASPPLPPPQTPGAAVAKPLPLATPPRPHAVGGPPLPRPLRPLEGPPRSSLPHGPGIAARAPPGPAPPPRSGRPGRGGNGSLGPGPHPAPGANPPRQTHGEPAGAIVVPLPSRTPAGGASAGHAERGPLAESVPRRMRQGVPATADVRIARDKIDGLMLALYHRGIRPELYPTRTLAVRLRAPNGGFALEAHSPETQWIDRSAGNPADPFAAWRWTITPLGRGRNRLLLTVSARLVGPDGLVAETAPSDRSIDVRIAPNYRRLVRRWLGWLAAVVAGAALVQFGGGLWSAAVLLIRLAVGA
jgi:hypothetical protein